MAVKRKLTTAYPPQFNLGFFFYYYSCGLALTCLNLPIQEHLSQTSSSLIKHLHLQVPQDFPLWREYVVFSLESIERSVH